MNNQIVTWLNNGNVELISEVGSFDDSFCLYCHKGIYYYVDHKYGCLFTEIYCMCRSTNSSLTRWTSFEIFAEAMRILTGSAPGDITPDFSLDEIADANDLIASFRG